MFLRVYETLWDHMLFSIVCSFVFCLSVLVSKCNFICSYLCHLWHEMHWRWYDTCEVGLIYCWNYFTYLVGNSLPEFYKMK
jgi:hypothetical protein